MIYTTDRHSNKRNNYKANNNHSYLMKLRNKMKEITLNPCRRNYFFNAFSCGLLLIFILIIIVGVVFERVPILIGLVRLIHGRSREAHFKDVRKFACYSNKYDCLKTNNYGESIN
jgi:hypothetical protein